MEGGEGGGWREGEGEGEGEGRGEGGGGRRRGRRRGKGRGRGREEEREKEREGEREGEGGDEGEVWLVELILTLGMKTRVMMAEVPTNRPRQNTVVKTLRYSTREYVDTMTMAHSKLVM